MVEKSPPKNKQRRMKRRFRFRTITLLIILVVVTYALILNLTNNNTVEIGEKAPDFKFTQINHNHEEENIQLSELEGKGVVLNFWAAYCEPCEAQMVFMEELYSGYKDDIEIVTVNLDNSELVAEQFIERFNFSFAVVHDERDEIMDMYHVSPIPTTFFISPEGEVLEEVVGSIGLRNLDRHMRTIVPEEGK